MNTYHLEVLVTYHWDVLGCFIWDLFETSWRRTDGTLSLRSLETSSWHTNKTSWIRTPETSWQRSTETLLGVSFETYLRRRWDVQRYVVTMSPQRFVAESDCVSNWVAAPQSSRCWTTVLKRFEKFIINKHNQKATDLFNIHDVTVYLTYIKILKDLNIIQ